MKQIHQYKFHTPTTLTISILLFKKGDKNKAENKTDVIFIFCGYVKFTDFGEFRILFVLVN